ncbi:MAG TPA: BBP7 family outer membrane beta-barrel protein, partial [Gemmataceae bacterium]
PVESTVAKAGEGPEAPATDKVEQPAKEPQKLPPVTVAPDDKNEPIATTPPPRLAAKPLDCTTAVLGKPRNASTEETVANPTRLYGSAEYLLWWTKSDHAPPLVTTGPASSNGILGQPGTQVLFGGPGTSLNSDVRQGGRFTLGYWLDSCQQCAIEGSFFFLENEQTRFLASSDAFPLLARPFFRINTGSEFSEIATRPDLTTGFVKVKSPTELWGAELNARHNLCCGCTYRIDGLAGARYLNLEDGIHVEENLVGVPTLPNFANDHIVVSDVFDTRNQFYGGQVGVDAELRRGRWFLDLKGKIALGDNHESLNIQGAQTITDPAGNVQVFRGGLLALNSNIGHFTRDRFAVVPEIGINVGYQVTDYMRVTVGYNFLYWSNVLRAADQIDRVIDETQIPNFGATHPPAGQNRPAVLFKETDYWAQGVTFGVEFRY